jgi:CubicO group peptidase (beta-lactamase class C family)
LGIVFLLTSTSLAAHEPNFGQLAAEIEASIEQEIIPGAAFIAGRGQEIVYRGTWGRLTYDQESPAVTLDTLYDLASVSKVVGTGTSTMILWSQGRITPDTTVGSIVPEFVSNDKGSVTVLQLATHTSGLKAYESRDRIERERKPEESTADATVRVIANLPTVNPPGTKVVYSCLNFLMLARVNETVAGQSQEEFLTAQLLQPAGMHDTHYLVPADKLERLAPSAAAVATGSVHDPLARYHGSGSHCPGNAGLFSTANDLAKFLMLIENKGRVGDQQLIAPEVLVASFRNLTSNATGDGRGFAWDVMEETPYVTELNRATGSQIVAHTGYTGTMIWLDLYSRAWFVLLSNRTYPNESPNSRLGITRLRKLAAEITLRAQPEYRQYFQTQDDEWDQ